MSFVCYEYASSADSRLCCPITEVEFYLATLTDTRRQHHHTELPATCRDKHPARASPLPTWCDKYGTPPVLLLLLLSLSPSSSQQVAAAESTSANLRNVILRSSGLTNTDPRPATSSSSSQSSTMQSPRPLGVKSTVTSRSGSSPLRDARPSQERVAFQSETPPEIITGVLRYDRQRDVRDGGARIAQVADHASMPFEFVNEAMYVSCPTPPPIPECCSCYRNAITVELLYYCATVSTAVLEAILELYSGLYESSYAIYGCTWLYYCTSTSIILSTRFGWLLITQRNPRSVSLAHLLQFEIATRPSLDSIYYYHPVCVYKCTSCSLPTIIPRCDILLEEDCCRRHAVEASDSCRGCTLPK